MKIIKTLIFFFFLIITPLLANDKITELIKNGKIPEAHQLLEQKYKEKNLAFNEFLQYFYLIEYLGLEEHISDFSYWVKKSKNPYAYIYALLRSEAVLGGTVKNTFQLKFIQELLNDNNCPSFIKSSILYDYYLHFFYTHNYERSREILKNTNYIEDWYFTGPFYNVSGSGMDKIFEPEKYPQKNKLFNTEYFGNVYWHKSPLAMNEMWVPISYHLPTGPNKLVYAQTFVYSPETQDVIFEIGFNGSIKIFLNDQVIFTEYKERRTDFGGYFLKAKLNKGYNRLLVKIGTEERSELYFGLRLLNKNFVPLQSCRIDKEYHDYNVDQKTDVYLIKSPVENYLQEQCELNSDNVYNYITLSRYYVRMHFFDEAIHYIEKAFQLEPDNPIVLLNRAYIYVQSNNQLKASEVYNMLQEKQPNSFLALKVEMEKHYANGSYEDALKVYDKISTLHPDAFKLNDYLHDIKIKIYAKLSKINEMIDFINQCYQQYPDNTNFVQYKANIEKEIHNNTKKSIKVLEKFLQRNFVYEFIPILIEKYKELMMTQKAERLIKSYLNVLYTDQFLIEVFKFYYTQKKFKDALSIAKRFVSAYPFNSSSWAILGFSYYQLQENDSAKYCFKKAIEFNHNNYEVISKLRELEGKESILNYDQHLSIDKLNLEKYNSVNLSGDYAILYNHKTTVLYPEGGRESMQTFVVKILNQKGIETFKEFALNSSEIEENSILDIFLVKPDKKKVFPEIYENNQIICSSLDVDDILYIKYKTQYYYQGKMSKNIHNLSILGNVLPEFNYIETFIIPKNMNIQLEKINWQKKYISVDTFTLDNDPYKIIRLKSDTLFNYTPENYCPATGEIAPVIHFSTFRSWREIAEWYYDVTFSKFDEQNIIVENTFQEIFQNNYNRFSAFEKASKIYQYITNNISYLSNSLAQDNLIPQNASKTIQKKLGDCKDISVLFVTLLQKAGVKSNLVLVRSNKMVQTAITQPNFLFDHCMAKFYDENNQEYIIELTNKHNPFLCIPYNVYKVWALDVPSKSNPYTSAQPYLINTNTRKPESSNTYYNFELKDNQLIAQIHISEFGTESSNDYANNIGKSKEEIKDYLYDLISKKFKGNMDIQSFEYYKDSNNVIHTKLTLVIDNFVQKVGNQFIFKIPYFYSFITQDALNSENRKFDFVYGDYEKLDLISDSIYITLANNKTFTYIPNNVSLNFNNTKYSLKFTKIKNNQLLITRNIHTNRDNIPANLYPKFKEFGNKILSSENEYISF